MQLSDIAIYGSDIFDARPLPSGARSPRRGYLVESCVRRVVRPGIREQRVPAGSLRRLRFLCRWRTTLRAMVLY